MEDAIDAALARASDDVAQFRGRDGDVRVHERGAAGRQGVLQIAHVTGRQVVDDDRALAFVDERVDQVTSEKAGPTGHEIQHQALPCTAAANAAGASVRRDAGAAAAAPRSPSRSRSNASIALASVATTPTIRPRE